MEPVLTADQVHTRAAELFPRWTLEEGVLVRTYETGSWNVSVLLVGAIAFLAEAANHHPDLLLTYPRVTVRLVSHDAGGVTQRDLELARRIEKLAVEEAFDRSVFPHAPRTERWVR